MKKPKIGVIAGLKKDSDPFRYVGEFGLKTCQLSCWNPAIYDKALASRVVKMSRGARVGIAALWAGYTGKATWNFIDGPATLGLVPSGCRAKRVKELESAADFAAQIGAPAIITHLGFIPENPRDRLYPPTVEAVRQVARRCRKNGIEFWFETGQETPVAMLRLIEDVDTGNLGINLDPANLILYGKANPVDALDVFGVHVRNLHVKDGMYPTDGMNLGREVQVGKGKVGFPRLMKRLRELKFGGELVIEREISGPQQARDIRKTVNYIKKMVDRLW